MAFGLTETDLDLIRSAIAKHAEIEEVLVFGSRAMGNHKRGSDIDLAVKGGTASRRSISSLATELNEALPLPYQFDVVDYFAIDAPALREHIDTHGRLLFKKDPMEHAS